MTAKTDAAATLSQAQVDATVRLCRQLLDLGLIVRRAGFTAEGALTVEMAGYADPDAPRVDTSDRPRVGSYRELVLSNMAPSAPRPTGHGNGSSEPGST